MTGKRGSVARPAVLIAIAGLIAVSIVLVRTSRYGAGIVSDDAVSYLSAAENVLAGNGFTNYRGLPYVHWPPLFPAVVALPGLVGIEPAVAARWINVLAFGAIVVFSGIWLRRRVQSSALVVCGVTAVVLSVPLVRMASFALSDALFVLLVFLFLMAIGRHLVDGKTSSLLLATAIAALSCLTRYVGDTVVFTGAILLLFAPGRSFLRRIRDIAFFGFVSVLPTVLWVVRNHRLTSTWTGERGASTLSLWESGSATMETLASWFLPVRYLPSPTLRTALGGATVLALVGLVAFAVRREYRDSDRGGRAVLLDAMPLVVFVVIFAAQLVSTATVVAYCTIDDRLLSPVFIPLVLLLVYAADRVRSALAHRTSARAATAIVVCGLGLLLAFPLAFTAKTTRYCRTNGAGGYSMTVWHDSDLIARVRSDPPPGRIVSNAPDAIYILAGRFADFSPRKHLYASPSSTAYDDLPAFVRSLSSGEDTYLVWFRGVDREYLYDLETLRRLLPMETVAELSHGTVYRVGPPSDAQAERD